MEFLSIFRMSSPPVQNKRKCSYRIMFESWLHVCWSAWTRFLAWGTCMDIVCWPVIGTPIMSQSLNLPYCKQFSLNFCPGICRQQQLWKVTVWLVHRWDRDFSLKQWLSLAGLARVLDVTQARNQLGTPGGAKCLPTGPTFFELCLIFLNYVQHILPGGAKNFLWGWPPDCGPVVTLQLIQLLKYLAGVSVTTISIPSRFLPRYSG